MGFPLTPRSMTLGDLELLTVRSILLEFRDISRVTEAITAKRLKIDPYCQRRNCSPLNVLFSDVQIALISQVVPQLGRQTTLRWQKQVFVYTQLSRAYLALARLSSHGKHVSTHADDDWSHAQWSRRLSGGGFYTVSQKTCDYIFYNNFNNKCPITIIFGTVSGKSVRHRKMVSFPTSPIQCNYLTME